MFLAFFRKDIAFLPTNGVNFERELRTFLTKFSNFERELINFLMPKLNVNFERPRTKNERRTVNDSNLIIERELRTSFDIFYFGKCLVQFAIKLTGGIKVRRNLGNKIK